MRASYGLAAVGAALMLAAADAPPPSPAYPEGFRDWRHVSSALIPEGHPSYAVTGGLHHIYANPQAMRGYREGKFPEGSVLVYDLLTTTDLAGVTREGPRRHVDVMVKDSARFAATGGWGYGEYRVGAREPVAAIASSQQASCSACHQARGTDQVISTLRD